MQRAIQFVRIGGLSAALIILTGCVTSESSNYRHHLDAVMQRDDAPRQDVASAFGLNHDEAKPGTVVANVPDDR